MYIYMIDLSWRIFFKVLKFTLPCGVDQCSNVNASNIYGVRFRIYVHIKRLIFTLVHTHLW